MGLSLNESSPTPGGQLAAQRVSGRQDHFVPFWGGDHGDMALETTTRIPFTQAKRFQAGWVWSKAGSWDRMSRSSCTQLGCQRGWFWVRICHNMVDYQELMGILSIPRPNGSAAERETSRALQNWLTRHRIPYRLHPFLLYPYFFECIGLWLIGSRSLLALAIWFRWGWPATLIAIIGLAGGTLDVVLNLPLVTWPGARRGENILIEFEPPNAKQEIIFSAHYDSKTELLDHRQRLFFLQNLRFGIFLTLLLGLLGPLNRWLLLHGVPWADLIFWAGVTFTIPLLFLAWGLGLNLCVGRVLSPSQGAVDNGTSCAILLGLAARLAKGEIVLQQTKVMIALFTGEEANMQGSRAYLQTRDRSLPAVAVNLEVMAQDGEYVFWEQDGNVFRLIPTSKALNEALSAAVTEVTGHPPRPAGPLISDGSSFLFAGIPASTLGTYDTRMKDTGFHRPTDNLSRVVMERLPEGVEIMTALLGKYDRGNISPHL